MDKNNKIFYSSAGSFLFSITALVLLINSMLVSLNFKGIEQFVPQGTMAYTVAPLLYPAVFFAAIAFLSGVFAFWITKGSGKTLLRFLLGASIFISGDILILSIAALF